MTIWLCAVILTATNAISTPANIPGAINAVATADLDDPIEPLLYPVTLDWPAEIQVAGPYRKSVSLRWTGAARWHVVTLKGTTPVAIYEPAVLQSFEAIVLPHAVNDLAVLSIEGRRRPLLADQLLVIGTGGLMLVDLVDGDPLTTLLLDGIAEGGTHVRVSDVDGDGDEDIAFVGSGGTSVSVMVQEQDGTFTPDPTLFATSSVGNIIDVDLLDIDGDSIKDVVIIGDDGLEIRNLEDDPWSSFPSVRADLDCMTVLPWANPVDGSDMVLWCTARSANTADASQIVFLVDASGLSVQEIVNHQVVALTAGDLNLDGTADAVASLATDDKLYLLYAQTEDGVSFSFDPEAAAVLELLESGLSGESIAKPLVTDLGNDGYSDIFQMIETTVEAYMMEGPLFSGGGGGGDELIGSFGPWSFLRNDLCVVAQNSSPEMVVYPPAGYSGLIDAYDDQFYRIETKVLRRQGGHALLDSDPASYCLERMNDYDLFDTPAIDALDIGFEARSMDDSFFLYLRAVRVDLHGDVVEAGPALIAAFTEDDAFKNEVRNEDLLWPGWDFDMVGDCSGGEGARINGFTRVRRTTPSGPNTGFPDPPTGNCHNWGNSN